MEVIEDILREGGRLADEVEVYLASGRSVSLELKREKISRAVESHSYALSIRTIDKGRIGTSSTSNPEDWQACLRASVASGKLASPQEWGGLPRVSPGSGKPLSFDPALETDPGMLPGILQGMIDGALRYPVGITGGGASIAIDRIILANSDGFRAERQRSHVSASIETISGQSTGSEFESSCSADFDPVAIGDRAGFLAAESAEGVDIGTGDYDIILSPIALAQLAGTVLIPSLSGRNVHAGRSRFAQSLGETILDSSLSITDEPLLENGLSSTRWDAEGTSTRQVPFVRKGILEAFAYDLKTAYRYGGKSTGSAIRSGPGGSPSIGSHNIVVDGPRTALFDRPGVYIHDVVGAHTANPFSGDFSVELTNPFLVDNGAYGEPVRKAMLSGNVFEMLRHVDGLGEDTRRIGSFVLPSIRIGGQHIIGAGP